MWYLHLITGTTILLLVLWLNVSGMDVSAMAVCVMFHHLLRHCLCYSLSSPCWTVLWLLTWIVRLWLTSRHTWLTKRRWHCLVKDLPHPILMLNLNNFMIHILQSSTCLTLWHTHQGSISSIASPSEVTSHYLKAPCDTRPFVQSAEETIFLLSFSTSLQSESLSISDGMYAIVIVWYPC